MERMDVRFPTGRVYQSISTLVSGSMRHDSDDRGGWIVRGRVQLLRVYPLRP
jgi:hypothetical protein